MATRVNTKVVVGIVAGIVVLCLGVFAIALWTAQQSGERNIARGDAAMQEGDYERAESQYSRAVNKQPTNAEYITKWGDALVRVVPETDVQFQERYNAYFGGVLTRLAQQRPQDGPLQIQYIKELVERMRLSGNLSVELADQLITTVSDRADGMREEDPDRARVLRWRGFGLSQKAGLVSLSEEEYANAVSDLEGAYAVDQDAAALVDLYRLHNSIASRAESDRRLQAASQARAAADAALGTLRADHAAHPSVIALDFLLERFEIVTGDGSVGDREQALRDAASRTVDRMVGIDVSKFETEEIVRDIASLGALVNPQDVGRLDAMLAKKQEEDPTNSSLRLRRAMLLSNANRYDEAQEILQSIVDMPNQAVSLDGLVLLSHRNSALYQRGDLFLEQAQFADSDEERDGFIAEARSIRDTLSGRISTGQEHLVTIIDMRIALLEGDNDEAITQLQKLDRDGFQDSPQVLLGYVQALLAKNQPGDARQKLTRLTQVRSGANSAQTLLYWGEIERMVGNFEASLDYYTRLDVLMPNNELVESRLLQLNALTGNTTEQEADPIIIAANRARELRSQGDLEGALAVLESAMSANEDGGRLMRFVVSLDLVMGNRDRAEQRLRDALAADPENRAYQVMLTQVEIEDPVEAQLVLINTSDESEISKALARESIYWREGRGDEAAAELAKAKRIDELDHAVISRLFVRAAMRGKEGYPEAEAAVRLAATANADGRNGEIYRGRFEILRGNLSEAISILKALTDSNEFDADAWRWLGAAQRSASLIDDSVKSYERAYTARPSDAGFAADYANALVAAGRGTEAAAVLSPETGVLKYGRASDQLAEMWMNLESQYGDRDRVLDMREKGFDRAPGSTTNTMAYVQLLLQDKEFERAREVIAQFEAEDNIDPIRYAQLRSALLASEGDEAGAAQVLEDFIASLPENQRTVDAFGLLARVYESTGNIEAAADALRRGRPYQQSRRVLDRSLADLQFRQAARLRSSAIRSGAEPTPEAEEAFNAAFREAESLYAELMSSGGFDELIAKRIAEARLRLNDFAGLDAMLDTIGEETGNPNDLQILLLRAAAYEEQGDMERRAEMLDKAVENNPTNPDAFYRRAQINSGIPERWPDVIADLERAVTLRPGFVEAWTLMARTHALQGEQQQAFQKIRGAIESNPNNERLPRVLVDLLVATGQIEAAFNEASDYAQDDNEDAYWVTAASRLAQRTGNYDEAYNWLTILDENTEFQDDNHALDRLNCLLRRNSGVDVPEVNRLMRRVELIEADGDGQLVLALLKARAEAARGNLRKSDALFIEAHDFAKPIGPVAYRLFVEALMLRHNLDQNKALGFIRDTEALRPLHPYLKLEMLQPNVYAARNDEQRQQVNAVLEAIGSEVASDDLTTQFRFYRLASDLRYALKDYEGSIQASRAALQIAPENAAMANNLAYTLSSHLGRHEEALPYALQAVEASPNSSYILDTLGVIYIRVGRVPEALRTLEKAIATATNEDAKAAALLHKTEALIESDELNEARLTLTRAQNAMNNSTPQTRELYGEDLQTLADRLQ